MKICTLETCDKEYKAKGYCNAHYRRFLRIGDPQEFKPIKGTVNCSVGGCDRIIEGQGLCNAHYKRYIENGDPGIAEIQFRSSNGVRRTQKNGYVALLVPDHPNSDANGVCAEHRFVMSNHLGRPLTDKETVHHKNGVKDDNRIENLELWTGSHPYGQRARDLLDWAYEIIELYEKDFQKGLV